jgi:hypothetical protein
MKTRVRTRREFLKDTATATIAGALYFSLPEHLFAQEEKKARVVLVRNKNVLDTHHKLRIEIVQQMLDEAVTVLVGESDPVQAWKKIVTPTDIVGIKSNIWDALCTPPELERVIEGRLIGAGVPQKNIGINDRGVLSDPLFLKSTALINVRPLRTHHWSGVGSLIKNYIVFLEDPSTMHPDTCADLASIWKLPLVKGKTRLNILVLFTPLFHGIGPHHFSPKHTWAYKGMLVGFDPVAIDSTGVRILIAKRKEFFGEERPLSPPPKHIFLADTRHHLGTADPAKIELIKMGWEEGILI